MVRCWRAMIVDYAYGTRGQQNVDLPFFNSNLTSEAARSIGQRTGCGVG